MNTSELLSQSLMSSVEVEGEKVVKNKSLKKDIRSVETLLKSVNNLPVEEKLKVLMEKCSEILEINKSLTTNLRVCEKQMHLLQREKEQLKTENGKTLLARSRLEELCRELQRQNKIIKEESIIRVREEEERRKEVSTKFQSTLAEVSMLLQQNNDKNQKLREENSEMATKLQMLCDQYSLREQHLDKLGKQYDIERQLNEAKLAKIRMDSAEVKEKMLREKQLLLLELTEYQKKCQTMQEEDIGLRQQLSMYTDKYDDFQQALKASNQQFVGFKTQMDDMTKKLKSLEKETVQWKQRWEKSNNLLIDMATEKKQRDSELINSSKQLVQLEKLCRALQTDRSSLINEIKSLKMSAIADGNVQNFSLSNVSTEISNLEYGLTSCNNELTETCHEKSLDNSIDNSNTSSTPGETLCSIANGKTSAHLLSTLMIESGKTDPQLPFALSSHSPNGSSLNDILNNPSLCEISFSSGSPEINVDDALVDKNSQDDVCLN